MSTSTIPTPPRANGSLSLSERLAAARRLIRAGEELYGLLCLPDGDPGESECDRLARANYLLRRLRRRAWQRAEAAYGSTLCQALLPGELTLVVSLDGFGWAEDHWYVSRDGEAYHVRYVAGPGVPTRRPDKDAEVLGVIGRRGYVLARSSTLAASPVLALTGRQVSRG